MSFPPRRPESPIRSVGVSKVVPHLSPPPQPGPPPSSPTATEPATKEHGDPARGSAIALLAPSRSSFESLLDASVLNVRLGRDPPPDSRGTFRAVLSTRVWKTIWGAFWIRNKGVILVILSQFFGALMNVTTRLLETDGSGMNPLQILFVRMAVTVILCCAYMWYTDVPHFPLGQVEVRGILALRGIGGFFGVFGLYYSLQYLPLAEATVLTFLAPILACWACAVLIKEPFSRMEQAAGLVSLFGVILIARPFSSLSSAPPGTIDIGKSDGMVSPNGTVDIISVGPPPVTAAQRLTAVGVAMVGVIGAACAYTTIRWIGKRAHPLISVNYFATWCTIVSTVALLVLPDIGFQLPRDVRQWLYLIILGVTGFIMQFLLTAGLAYEKSSRGTNMIYTLMLFALAFDKLVWGTNPDLTSVTGGSLILGAAIYVAACQGSRKSALESTDAHKNGETADEERGLVNGIDDDEDDDDEPSVLPLEDSFRGVPEAPLRSARI